LVRKGQACPCALHVPSACFKYRNGQKENVEDARNFSKLHADGGKPPSSDKGRKSDYEIIPAESTDGLVPRQARESGGGTSGTVVTDWKRVASGVNGSDNSVIAVISAVATDM
jgi:hypothetical protein